MNINHIIIKNLNETSFHFWILLKKMHSKWLCFLAGNSQTFTYFEQLDMKIQVHIVNTKSIQVHVVTTKSIQVHIVNTKSIQVHVVTTKSTVYLFHILPLWTSCVASVEVRLRNLTRLLGYIRVALARLQGYIYVYQTLGRLPSFPSELWASFYK